MNVKLLIIIKAYLKEMGYEGIDWSNLAQDRNQ
jgi:hypothetical protein